MGYMKAWSSLRNIWYGLQLDNNDRLKVASPVKGAPATAFALNNAQTASGVIDATGAIGIIIDTAGVTWSSGTCIISLLGSVDNTTFKAVFTTNGSSVAQLIVSITSAVAGAQVTDIIGIPDYIQLIATGTFGCIGPVKYQLIY